MRLRTGLAITNDRFPKDFQLAKFELDGESAEVLRIKLLRQFAAVVARQEHPDDDVALVEKMKLLAEKWNASHALLYETQNSK